MQEARGAPRLFASEKIADPFLAEPLLQMDGGEPKICG